MRIPHLRKTDDGKFIVFLIKEVFLECEFVAVVVVVVILNFTIQSVVYRR
jgi:hypothetical protein